MHQAITQQGLLVLGGGGHAKVVIATARAMGIELVGVLDDDHRKIDGDLSGVRILSRTTDLCHFSGSHCVLAIGNNSVRRRLFEMWRWRQLSWQTLIHPTAFVEDSSTIGEGSVVFAGASIQVDVRIGDHCIINTQASVDHDCTLGDFVHLAPGCRLAGNVTVEDGAFLGIGSCVIPGLTIGANATVGAGAVVIKDVPPGATVVGNPGRQIS